MGEIKDFIGKIMVDNKPLFKNLHNFATYIVYDNDFLKIKNANAYLIQIDCRSRKASKNFVSLMLEAIKTRLKEAPSEFMQNVQNEFLTTIKRLNVKTCSRKKLPKEKVDSEDFISLYRSASTYFIAANESFEKIISDNRSLGMPDIAPMICEIQNILLEKMGFSLDQNDEFDKTKGFFSDSFKPDSLFTFLFPSEFECFEFWRYLFLRILGKEKCLESHHADITRIDKAFTIMSGKYIKTLVRSPNLFLIPFTALNLYDDNESIFVMSYHQNKDLHITKLGEHDQEIIKRFFVCQFNENSHQDYGWEKIRKIVLKK